MSAFWRLHDDSARTHSIFAAGRSAASPAPWRMSLTQDPIPLLTRQIAIPASVGYFFNTMFNLVDTYSAGLLNTDALAALSLSFPVFFVMLAVGSGLSQGTTALVASAIGAGDRDAARRIFAQAMTLSVFLGLALTAAVWWCAPLLFRVLGAEGSYLRAAVAYMNALGSGTIFFVLQMSLNSALSAEGNTRLYRNFLIFGCLANCFLNPFFMWGWLGLPAMGVAGIGLATVLVQIGGCLLLWRGLREQELFSPAARGTVSPGNGASCARSRGRPRLQLPQYAHHRAGHLRDQLVRKAFRQRSHGRLRDRHAHRAIRAHASHRAEYGSPEPSRAKSRSGIAFPCPRNVAHKH